jgi:hypothetical protein
MSAHHPALKGKIVRALPGMLDTDNSVPDYPAETWAVAAPKRTFAAPIAIGTIDQALLSSLRCVLGMLSSLEVKVLRST